MWQTGGEAQVFSDRDRSFVTFLAEEILTFGINEK